MRESCKSGSVGEAAGDRRLYRTIGTAPNSHLSRTARAVCLKSVRKVYEGLQSLRSMRRMEASRRNASALSVRCSKSFARRRQRFSQAIVRSTTQRIGRTSNPLALSDRFTISTASPAQALGHSLGELWPLVGGVSKQLEQERVCPEQRRQHQHAAVAILDVGRMDDGVQQQA